MFNPLLSPLTTPLPSSSAEMAPPELLVKQKTNYLNELLLIIILKWK